MVRIVPSSVAIAGLSLFIGVLASERAAALPVPLQPLAQQAHQMENAMAYLGQPFSAEEISKIDQAVAEPNESKAVERLQNVLDAHVLAVVQINAESRVKVEAGPAQPELVEAGTRLFLVPAPRTVVEDGIIGTRDFLLSGTTLYHWALLRAEVDAELVVFEAMPHAHWIMYHDTPEAAEAFNDMAKFFDQKVGKSAAGN